MQPSPPEAEDFVEVSDEVEPVYDWQWAERVIARHAQRRRPEFDFLGDIYPGGDGILWLRWVLGSRAERASADGVSPGDEYVEVPDDASWEWYRNFRLRMVRLNHMTVVR